MRGRADICCEFPPPASPQLPHHYSTTIASQSLRDSLHDPCQSLLHDPSRNGSVFCSCFLSFCLSDPMIVTTGWYVSTWLPLSTKSLRRDGWTDCICRPPEVVCKQSVGLQWQLQQSLQVDSLATSCTCSLTVSSMTQCTELFLEW